MKVNTITLAKNSIYRNKASGFTMILHKKYSGNNEHTVLFYFPLSK